MNGLALAAASVISATLAAQQRDAPGDLAAMLARIGDHVEQYYARARTIVCIETVHLQPLALDLTQDGHARRLVYELRVAWEPPSEGDAPGAATVLRQLVSVDGKPPRPKDNAGCMDPKPVSPEPLALLLPIRRHEYAFAWAGSGRTNGRATVMLDYKSTASGPADVVCATNA